MNVLEEELRFETRRACVVSQSDGLMANNQMYLMTFSRLSVPLGIVNSRLQAVATDLLFSSMVGLHLHSVIDIALCYPIFEVYYNIIRIIICKEY